MKKILFPLDFSPTSLNAFAYALHFAQKVNAEIVTLHVYEIPGPAYIDFKDFVQENYGVKELSEFENYWSEVPELRDIAKMHHLEHVRVTHVLRAGFPVKDILEAADAEAADYIMMGTKGVTGLAEIFIGSVAEKVMNGAHIPVLAIPDGCSYRAPHRILFLTRYEEADKIFLRTILALAAIFHARVEVLQIRPEHNEKEKDTLKQWKSEFLQPDVSFNVLATNDLEDTVLDFIELNKVDLVTMTVRQKGFIEKLFFYSLAKKMAFHSTVPILAIPIRNK